MTYSLGSLFDGSGGFPLAGTLCGIEPRWASEVEPYPIAVTRSRFPTMKHLGDISKINGAEIEPVDIITFGSPCQDLSMAGKRAGINEGTRSGLFIEAVRIIKEMSEATNGKYPTFALWENVPGAFSSNKGEDFRLVLEELIKIVEPSATVPEVPSKGWAYADSYLGEGWSLAYRVLNAQHWGVAQRRRRVFLVLDLRGERACQVLFEREGLRGNFIPNTTARQENTAGTQGGTGTKTASTYIIDQIGGRGEFYQKSIISPTLRAGGVCAIIYETSAEKYVVRRPTPTECARLQGFPDDWGRPKTKEELTEEAFRFWKEVRNTHAVVNGRAAKDYTEKQMLAWYNKLHSDSAEYKMWGNGIALPTALYCMQGLADALSTERRNT